MAEPSLDEVSGDPEVERRRPVEELEASLVVPRTLRVRSDDIIEDQRVHGIGQRTTALGKTGGGYWRCGDAELRHTIVVEPTGRLSRNGRLPTLSGYDETPE